MAVSNSAGGTGSRSLLAGPHFITQVCHASEILHDAGPVLDDACQPILVVMLEATATSLVLLRDELTTC